VDRIVNKRLLLDLLKYLLAISLLVWVIRANWAPTPTRDIASLAASTMGLSASPGLPGPLLAAVAATPGRIDSRGLGYVWQRHVVDRQPIQRGMLLAGFALYVTSTLVTVLRWYFLVRALDLPLELRDAFRYGFIGIFFNTFLPGAVGGDIIKAAALARTQNRRTAAVASVIMDRVIALWALFWFVSLLGGIFLLTGMLSGPAVPVASFVISVAGMVVVVTMVIWQVVGLLSDERAERFAQRLSRLPLVGPTAGEFWRSVWVYRRRGRAVAGIMALAWVGHIGFVLSFWCCAQALWNPHLGPIPSLTEHFLLVPMGMVMQAVIPTPGGAGGGEWSFAALYLLFGAAEANGVLASLVQRMLSWVLGLVGYGVYASMRQPQTADSTAEVVTTNPDLLPASPSAVAG
jgi:hypothetical protein